MENSVICTGKIEQETRFNAVPFTDKSAQFFEVAVIDFGVFRFLKNASPKRRPLHGLRKSLSRE